MRRLAVICSDVTALLRRIAAAETTEADAETVARLLAMPTLREIYHLEPADGWEE